MNVKTEKAISATRIFGIWVIQSSYGRDARPADETESQALENAWDGDTNGSGDPWVALPLPLPLASQYIIRSTYSYYQGTFNAPKNGNLKGACGNLFVFASREAAGKLLIRMGCEENEDGSFSAAGTYVTAHGEYARPVYRIRKA